MDISNLTKNLSKGLQQKSNAELTALSRVLDVALGKVTIAQVTETIPVTPEERQALLTKTAAALQQLNKAIGSTQLTPAAKEEVARLMEQQTLIKSPDLKWVNLLVNNRQLLTYSDKPLAAGQTVAVRLVAPEKLMLLDLPETDTAETAAKSGNSDTLRATYTAQSLATQAHTAKSIPAASEQKTPASTPAEVSTLAENSPETAIAIKNAITLSSAATTAKIQMAEVTETAPITADERQELLKKTTEELVQLGKMAQSTAGAVSRELKEAIASLLQQQALIKSPNTQWVHLRVNNQVLLTYSDKPLVPGQAVPVQVLTPQKILLLDLPETANAPTKTPTANTADIKGSDILGPETETVDSKLKTLTDTINSALSATKNPTPTYFARLAAAEQSVASPAPEEGPDKIIVTKNTESSTNSVAPAKTYPATITQTAPLLPEERQELLKKTTEELAQLSKMASASTQPVPGLKEAINSLLQQQALIKAPAAKWVHLQVGNQSLLTYSDKLLSKGQTVPVQLVTAQKILLLDLPETDLAEANPVSEKSIAPPSKNPTPTYFAKFAAADFASSVSEAAPEEPANKVEAKNTVTLTTAAAAPAKIQLATVTETAPLLPEEREELLKKTTEELAQLNKIAAGSTHAVALGAKDAIASLLQQQALLKSPATQWLHLSVNNQTLLTYSDKPLAVGQTVPVQIINPQKIALLDLPDSNIKVLTETISKALASQKNITPTYFAQLATATPATAAPNIQIATAIQTVPISADERQELLKKTSEELLQLNKMPSTTPGVKEAIASLLHQQALIKSPEAKWLHLQVNNQSLLTYSEKPIAAGQSVPVQIITPQKILLLDLPQVKNATAATENIPATLAAQKNATPTYFATLAYTAEPAKTAPPTQPIIQQQLAQTAPVVNTQGTSTQSAIEIATVVKTSQVSPQQRQELLQKISHDLQQINKLASSSAQTIPSVKEIITSLLEQQALVKSPNLKWLELSVNNRPLTTYSDKPLSPGQTLQLQTTATQNLALLDNDQIAASLETASAVKNAPQSEKLLPPAGIPKSEFSETEDPLPAPASPTSPWQNIPSPSRQILTPKTLEQALKSVAEQIRAQLQFTQPSNTAASPTAQKTAETNSQTQAPAANIANAQVTKSNVSGANASGITTADNKITVKNAQAISGQSAMLAEIDQVLNGGDKPLSTQLTAKILHELIKHQAATVVGNQAIVSNNKPAQITGSSSQDIELDIQQLLNKPASDTASKELRAQLLQLMKHDPETFKEMDISKLTQHLSKGLEQKNNAELTAISRALNITLGKVVMADVSETAPVTPQERKELLAKTNEALAQLNKLASNPAQLTPAAKAAISQLLEQQALIQSPTLKWATLSVNNQPLLTYTDKPLSAGQAVPVQLVDAQKLVLLTLPESGSTTKHSTVNLTAAALGTNPTYSAKLANAALTTDLAKNLTATTTLAPDAATIAKAQTAAANSLGKPGAEVAAYKPDAQQIKQVVAENLRRLLPYKDTPSELLSALTQWQKLPAASQQRLAPVTVEQALKNLAEQIRSPLQIIQPKILAQIIKNSGVFFESVLSNNLASEAPGSDSTKPTTTEGNKTVNPATNPTVAQTFNQDLKGSLLSLLSKVNQELTGSSKPLSDEQTVRLLQQLSTAASNSSAVGATYTPANAAAFAKHNLPVDLGLLIQQVMTKPVKELSDKELRSQLLVLLQQHSVHSLAKIQLQQLASLNSEVTSKDPSQPTASWQIEIPVRHHNEVQQLQLRIDREWVEEKNTSAENKTVAKVKQWSVTLRFDLPTLGEFCAQLAIIDTSVSATLWANEEKTFGQVRKQMEDLRKNLEKEGIQVKQLQCMKGMPAEKPMALSYSLIDIST